MSTSPSRRNEQVVRRLYELAINEGRSDLFKELVAADYVGANGERGPDGFADTAQQLRAGIAGLRFAVLDVVSSDDRVAVHWSWSGTHTGKVFGIDPTHKRVDNVGMAIYGFRTAKSLAPR